MDKTDVSGKVERERTRRTYTDLIGEVHKKGQVLSTWNRRKSESSTYVRIITTFLVI